MKKVLYSFLIFSCLSGYAQTQFNNLNECLEYSDQNNPSLKIDLLNRKVSHEKVKSAWAALLPQVKAFGTVDDNINLPVQLVPAQLLGGAEGDYAKVKFGTQYNATYGAEASLSLVNISNWKNIKSSAFAEEASTFQQQDHVLNIHEQLITSYYFALLSREAIALNQDLVNSGDSLLSAAEVRFNNGLIELLEFNRVKSLYLESLQQLRESQGAYQKNLNTLKSLCGLHSGDTLILTESIAQGMQENHSPASLAVSFSQLPRHKMLSTKMLQAQEDLKRQRSKIFPELSLYARISRQSFSDEFNFFSNTQPWFDVAVAGFRAEWNLFTGFSRQSTIQQASLQLQITRHELDNYSLQAEKELDELRINHQVAAHGVGRFLEHYQLNAINYRIAGEKYKQGIYTIDQYVTIYQEMVRSQNQYLGKLANYMVYESMVNSKNALQ